MLALLATSGTRLDAGAIGLALARVWSDAGEKVLFVDADTTGARLAERLGAAERARYAPATRGLPSLVAGRQPLTLESVAPHCYSMAGGLLWTLFGPFHPDGGAHAAGWLAARSGEMEAIDSQRTVVLATSIRTGGTAVDPLLRAANVVVLLSPVSTGEQADKLGELLRDAALTGSGRGHRVLLVEGDSPLDDDEIRAAAGVRVIGRLPVIDDDRVLRIQSWRKEKTFARHLNEVADRLRSLATLEPDAAALQPL